MTKDELLGNLQTVLKNYVVGMVLVRVVTSEQIANATAKDIFVKGKQGEVLFPIHAHELGQTWATPAERDAVILQYENGLERALLREGHEAILHYCEETGQCATYKAEPWFQFARIIRNITSHKDGGRLRDWPKDLHKAGIKTVSWRHSTLDCSMVGKEIPFYPFEALPLFQDQMECADKRLK